MQSPQTFRAGAQPAGAWGQADGREGPPGCRQLAMLPEASQVPGCQGAGRRQGCRAQAGAGHLHLTCRIWSLRLAWR